MTPEAGGLRFGAAARFFVGWSAGVGVLAEEADHLDQQADDGAADPSQAAGTTPGRGRR